MNETVLNQPLAWFGTGRLRELLDLARSLKEVEFPILTRDQMRQALDVMVKMMELFSVDQARIDWLRARLSDPLALDIALAILGYITNSYGWEKDGELRVLSTETAGKEIVVDAQSLVMWLPTVIMLLNLLRQIRGKNE